MDNHRVTASVPVPRETTLLAFFPHMHLRGKAFRYEAILPGGDTRVLLDIPRYDFNWQLSYRFAEPVTLPAGSTLRATAWYDNSDQNPANPDPTRTVPWGPQTYDEMMIGYVEYHMDEGSLGGGSRLREFLARRGAGGRAPAGGDAGLAALFQQLDKNADGKLSESELPEAQKERLLKLDSNKDGVISLDEAKRLSQHRSRPN